MADTASAERVQPPVGIDLGTTYSVLAYLDTTGRPVTVPNSSGDLLTPSAVLIEDDAVIVGNEACKNAILSPELYSECFKRDMGLGSYHRPLRSQRIPPEVLSAFVLERLKKDAELRLGPIRQVVITVPAFFDELRRKATQDAGRLAGLEVSDIINEPTAAALAFGYQQGIVNPLEGGARANTKRVLVYDLGGGTFDASILEIDGNTFRTLATDGAVSLGGKDFDERLVNYLAEKFLAAHGADPRSDPQDAMQLWRDAEDAKHALSERTKTTVVCFHAGIRMRIEVTRPEFEDLTRDLLERTRTTTSLVLQQAGLRWDQLDRVLVVGGSSRMPMVSQMLAELSGREPDRSASPDEAVAHGAALYAGMLTSGVGNREAAPYRLINVNSHSLGVVGTHTRTGRKVNVILVPKNTPLPHRAAKKFKMSSDGLRAIKVPVVEGESRRPEECIALGQCVVGNLPPGLPKGTEIIVEFHYETNGRISVLGRVPRTRQSAQVQILREKQHNLEDLQTWRTKLCTCAGEISQSPSSTEQAQADVGVSAAGGPEVDRAGLMRRLDALYMKLGEHAVKMRVPPALTSSQQGASEATKEWKQARAVLEKAQQKQQSATGRAEALQLMTEITGARMGLKQAETKAGFALLVLGRECHNSNFCPPGAERESRDVHRLKAQLESLS